MYHEIYRIYIMEYKIRIAISSTSRPRLRRHLHTSFTAGGVRLLVQVGEEHLAVHDEAIEDLRRDRSVVAQPLAELALVKGAIRR